jgi:hypothetical protein
MERWVTSLYEVQPDILRMWSIHLTWHDIETQITRCLHPSPGAQQGDDATEYRQMMDEVVI